MTGVKGTGSSSAKRHSLRTAPASAKVRSTGSRKRRTKVARREGLESIREVHRRKDAAKSVGETDGSSRTSTVQAKSPASLRRAAEGSGGAMIATGDGPRLRRGLTGAIDRAIDKATQAVRDAVASTAAAVNNAQASVSGSDNSCAMPENQVALMRDVATIDQAADQGAAQGAAALEACLNRPGVDDAYRQDLLQMAQPAIEQIGRDLAERKGDDDVVKPALASLTRAAELAGAEGACTIADAVAKSFPNGNLKDLDNGIQEAIEAGHGTQFAVNLSNAMHAAGKSKGADDVAKAAAKGVDKLREDFARAADAVDDHNEELAYMDATYGPMLTPEQREQAAAAHMKHHEDDYNAYEQAGERLAGALEGLGTALEPGGEIAQRNNGGFPITASNLLTNAAHGALAELPRLSGTPGGTQAIGQALEAKGRGEASFIDALPRVIDAASDPDAMREGMASALLDGATTHALLLDSQGQGARVTQVGSALADALQTIDMVDAGEAEALRDSFQTLSEAENQSDFEQWTDQFKTVTGQLKKLSQSDMLKQRLRNFGVVVGCLNTAAKISQLPGRYAGFDSMSDVERADLLAETLGVGASGARDVIKAMNLAGKLDDGLAETLGTRFKTGGAVLAGISAAIDAGRAIDAFADRRFMEGTSFALSAAGSALGAAAMLGASIPGGQIAAAALLAGGLLLGHINKVRQSNKWEGPTERYLEGAGIDHDIAKQLSNHDGEGRSPGPVLERLATRFGMSPQEMMSWLQTLEPGQVKDIMEAAHGVDPNDDGHYPVGDDDDCTSGDLFDRPDNLNGLANWMAQWGLAPGAISDYGPLATVASSSSW